MWEQITVRIIVMLILQKLNETKEYKSYVKELTNKNIMFTELKELEDFIFSDSRIQFAVVALGANIITNILNIGKFLKR